ncbi:MAG: hypothetical protein WBA46_10975 [Thermomicrobiales bacterium]
MSSSSRTATPASPARPARRGWAAIVASATTVPATSEADDRRRLLPPRYHDGRPVSNAPMGGAAGLVYDAEGKVAWDRIWADFCDLALAGGPPHRETMLEAPAPDVATADPSGMERAMTETIRGLAMITGWEAHPAAQPGWVTLACPDVEAATWLERAIVAENVRAVQDDADLRLPVGPDFTLEQQIKNVITATAKAHHYWAEHRAWLDALLAGKPQPS